MKDPPWLPVLISSHSWTQLRGNAGCQVIFHTWQTYVCHSYGNFWISSSPPASLNYLVQMWHCKKTRLHPLGVQRTLPSRKNCNSSNPATPPKQRYLILCSSVVCVYEQSRWKWANMMLGPLRRKLERSPYWKCSLQKFLHATFWSEIYSRCPGAMMQVDTSPKVFFFLRTKVC